MKNHLVVVLAYDRLCTFEFGCAVEVFGLRRPELGVDWYDFAVHAVDKGPIAAAGGVKLQVPRATRLLERADTIIVPGWRGVDAEVPAHLRRRLRAAHARGARLCSICSGVFVLAAAGLLDGRTVTTHWRDAALLAERYPALRVAPDALYIDDDRIVTAAGSASGLDMMLHLVRSDHGARVANLVAQRLVISPHRDGGQAQFVPRPVPASPGPGRIPALMAWVRGHLRREHTVDTMAVRAAMSVRTLHRQFMDATGMPPHDWLVRERVACAKDMLEAPGADLARVAERAGFTSPESFRRHFRRVAGTSPSAYRAKFVRG